MDRVVQASTEFINRVLGRKFLRDDPPDLSTALKQSLYPTPIVLFFTNGEVKSKNQIKSLLYLRYYAEACSELRGPSPRFSAPAT